MQRHPFWSSMIERAHDLPEFDDEFTLSAEAIWIPPVSVADLKALEEASGCEVRLAVYVASDVRVAAFVTFYSDGPDDRDWT